MTKKPEPILWLDEVRGRYIPRDFANSFRNRDTVSGVDAEQWSILEAGPDHDEFDFYWEVWAEVLSDAVIDDYGIKYRVHQDGDCWLIPEGMEWSDDEACFIWPAEPDTYARDAEADQRRADAAEGFEQ